MIDYDQIALDWANGKLTLEEALRWAYASGYADADEDHTDSIFGTDARAAE